MMVSVIVQRIFFFWTLFLHPRMASHVLVFLYIHYLITLCLFFLCMNQCLVDKYLSSLDFAFEFSSSSHHAWLRSWSKLQKKL